MKTLLAISIPAIPFTLDPLWVHVFLILYMWAGSMGFPFPEDIALISAGVASHSVANTTPANVYSTMVWGLFGILSGDSLIYCLGYYFGPWVLRVRWFRRLVTPDRFEVTKTYFERHGVKTVFVARFMPGVRFVTFLAAGVTRFPYWKFIAANGTAALVSAPLWVLVGYMFADNIDPIVHFIERAKRVILVVVLTAGVALLTWWLVQRRRAKAAPPPAATSEPPAPLPAQDP